MACYRHRFEPLVNDFGFPLEIDLGGTSKLCFAAMYEEFEDELRGLHIVRYWFENKTSKSQSNIKELFFAACPMSIIQVSDEWCLRVKDNGGPLYSFFVEERSVPSHYTKEVALRQLEFINKELTKEK